MSFYTWEFRFVLFICSEIGFHDTKSRIYALPTIYGFIIRIFTTMRIHVGYLQKLRFYRNLRIYIIYRNCSKMIFSFTQLETPLRQKALSKFDLCPFLFLESVDSA